MGQPDVLHVAEGQRGQPRIHAARGDGDRRDLRPGAARSVAALRALLPRRIRGRIPSGHLRTKLPDGRRKNASSAAASRSR
jgi:hypothetical protein